MSEMNPQVGDTVIVQSRHLRQTVKGKVVQREGEYIRVHPESEDGRTVKGFVGSFISEVVSVESA